MEIAAQLVTSFIASAAFGILFNAPKNVLIQCGFNGMAGWIVYFLLVQEGMDSVPATILAAMLVAIISRFFSKRYKTPIIIFNVSGIIPLVPGGMAYNAMRSFVQHDYINAVQYSAKVMLLAGGIAMGLMFSEVINQIIIKTTGKKKRTQL
ncbi:threonine/serine exporter family protein [Ornithinibacillus halotolerans]|uniref:Membrane protein n=1 Tax=Ornithinibacillus halotolerans TaxID=1274357 RepID=A0A916W4A7_9BACI|nr:threonine/serine exporter family protein [Ornithinibacillus halotolerans]GGA64541.1 membrane protein [Ornithinibacillus halotolerans]